MCIAIIHGTDLYIAYYVECSFKKIKLNIEKNMWGTIKWLVKYAGETQRTCVWNESGDTTTTCDLGILWISPVTEHYLSRSFKSVWDKRCEQYEHWG